MRSVRLFDYLQYDGQSWQVISQDGTMLALKNLTTGRIRKLAVGDLLGDDSYLPDPPERLPNLDNVAVLEALDPDTRQPHRVFAPACRRGADRRTARRA